MNAEEERILWEEFCQDKNDSARLALIDHYSYLAKICAKHFYSIRTDNDIEYGDYLQSAMVGLIEAVQRYNPDKGASFSTFANYRIKGALLNSLEKATQHREQTAYFRRLQRSRLESIADGISESGCDPFAEMVDVTIELALSFMLEDTGLLLNDDQSADELYDREVVNAMSAILDQLVDKLPERERLIIRNHYYHGMVFEELAELLSISKGRVSQLHKRALSMIKEAYENRVAFDATF